jgi:protein-tyrosine phosphatase
MRTAWRKAAAVPMPEQSPASEPNCGTESTCDKRHERCEIVRATVQIESSTPWHGTRLQLEAKPTKQPGISENDGMNQNDVRTVLFLCTGNYYRSRFAEFYFNALATERRLPWQADSRGLRINAGNPGPVSRSTLAWLQERGIAVPGSHRFPMPASAEDFRAADLVVAVKEAEHRPLMEGLFPQWVEKVEFWHVHDLDFAMPEESLPKLAVHVEELIERLKR